MHTSIISPLIVAIFTLFSLLAAAGTETTERLDKNAELTMATYGESIYKVRIVNIQSGDTSVYGTGFFIADGHLLATNYHVASSVILEPENYKAVLDIEKQEKEIKVIAVDVVHDLAILYVDKTMPSLILSASPPAKGARLFSIGNPHSLGMTVVEGNYNGLIEDRFLDQIHFSGAINSGMSGGPALNANGEVVGINVATSGNQIGFLVPVEKLILLLERVKSEFTNDGDATVPYKFPTTEQLKSSMSLQIETTTGDMIAKLMAEEWTLEEVGDAKVIGKMHDNMECWGNSDDDEKKHTSYIRKGCNNSISMYVNRHLTTGYIEYESWFLEADDWPVSAFYRRLHKMFDDFHFGNRATKDDVHNSECISEVVDKTPESFKRNVVFCARAYKDYKGLYDTFFVSMSVDQEDKAIFEHFTLSGVNRDDANSFLQRFLKQAGWQ